jgi:hypothetical protein
MYNKQRDNHNRRQITGKKPRIYAVFKTFCIVASQANDRQTSINYAFPFLKVQETTVLCGFQHRAKTF